MELKFTIKKGKESVECYANFDEESENFYYVQDDIVTEDPNVLNVSEEFKLELGIWDVPQWLCDSIPYGLSTRTGIKFEFDCQHFIDSLKTENLYPEWKKIRNIYGSNVELLEKGLITPKLILREYNKLMEESL